MQTKTPLSEKELQAMHAWWRAANYLSVGQIYLMANPLLREPLKQEHVKPRLLGHFGTTPGLNCLYAHLSRVIKARDLSGTIERLAAVTGMDPVEMAAAVKKRQTEPKFRPLPVIEHALSEYLKKPDKEYVRKMARELLPTASSLEQIREAWRRSST